MREQIKIKSHELVNETISNIQELVKIDSVRDTDNAAPGAPFGPGVKESFDLFEKQATSIGMKVTRDPEGMYAYAEIGPEGAEMVGVLGHLDVVPVGEEAQWTKAKPFSADIIDDVMYGRGTLDDKGPVVIALMSIKALLDAGVELKKRIRVIVGGAEETTWECINSYVEKEEVPTMGFTPDADFPVIHAEKSIIMYDAIIEGVDNDFTVTSPGPYNAVADQATYTGSKKEEIEAELAKLGYAFESDGQSVTTKGKSAHAMQCHLGDNAIYKLVEAMYNVGERCATVDFLYDKVIKTNNGEKILGEVKDEVSGVLTLNVGVINISKDKELFGIDSRVPVLIDEMEIEQKYKDAVAEYGHHLEVIKIQEKLYEPIDGPLVSTLLKVYQEVTGDTETKPLTTGGGTYARAMKGHVAYGLVFQPQNMNSQMHQPNECLELKFVPMALEIYALALYELTEM
ncbi:MAG: Sapep family Mn(2+)-dependent dipeptidase [Mycoplasmatales bacterium]